MDRRSISSNLAYLVFGLFLVGGVVMLGAVAAFAPPPDRAVIDAVKVTKTTGSGSSIPSGTAPENVRAIFGAKCLTCHQAPGINGGGAIGPNLAGIANRQIAGVLPPTLENMQRWLENPQAVKPGTAMPAVPKTEAELQTLAEFMLTLR